MTIQFSVEVKGLKGTINYLNHINKNMPELGEKIRRRLADRTKSLAKSYVRPRWGAGYGPFKYPGSSGYLKSSIIYRKESVDSTLVVAQAPYAGFVELGTRPHPMPNNWFWSRTGHPGSRPMKFMEKAYVQVVKEADEHIATEVNKFFKKAK